MKGATGVTMRLRGLLLAVTLTPALAPRAVADEAADSTFQRGDGSFRLKAVARTIASPYTGATMQVDYSVYRNGKFLHRAEADGGTVTGCTYGGATNLPKSFVAPLAWKGATYGWVIRLLGVCGNTTSKKLQLVVVTDRQKDRYFTKTFVTKGDPILRDEGADLGVWFVYQAWGDGGTSSSFFVPATFKVSLTDPYAPFARLPYPADTAAWPAYKDFPYSLPSYVVAGIDALDAAPVRDAAARLTPKDAEHLGYVGLPKTKAGLEALAAGLDESGAYVRKFRRDL